MTPELVATIILEAARLAVAIWAVMRGGKRP